MKKIIKYKYGTTDYNVGDVVYLYHKKGKPTCRARALYEDNGKWRFKLMRKQAYYHTSGGVIPFGSKPYIYAKQVEAKEEQP